MHLNKATARDKRCQALILLANSDRSRAMCTIECVYVGGERGKESLCCCCCCSLVAVGHD